MPIHDWSLVSAGVFHDFHHGWVGRLKSVLNEELLPQPFYALVEPLLGEAEPDVIALQARTASPWQQGEQQGEASGTEKRLRSDATEGAVALAPCPVRVEDIVLDAYARKTRQIVIKDAWEGDRAVAVIELVSVGNKTSRARADQFLRKRVGLLQNGVHLLILDLHRPTAIVPEGFHPKVSEDIGHEPSRPPADRPLSAVSYQVLEAGALRAHFVPLKAGDSLPEMPVFLSPHEFVRLPLERTYGEAFRSVSWKFREILARGG
ncbi:MAG: DUF4058 family protein [Planctomycetes bacterium]|nr:DUF4058 family protein [Planctomycetota bacterium]